MSEAAGMQDAARSGAEEPLISIGEAPLDRMPALTLIFEAATSGFTKALVELSDIPAALELEELDAKRVSDVDEQCAELPTRLVYVANGLDAKAVVAVDDDFREIIVEMLLGASAIGRSPQQRAATKIESQLVNFAVGKFLTELTNALAPIVEVSFERDLLCEETGFGAVGQRAAVTIVGRCRLKCIEREGSLVIVLPRAALDPFRAALSQFPGAEGVAHDERWSENLYDHIVRTEVKVNVKIEARGFTLDDIAALEVGDVLRLPIAPTSPIRVESEGRTLFWCTLGQKDGHYTVRLEDFSDERQSFIENILGM